MTGICLFEQLKKFEQIKKNYHNLQVQTLNIQNDSSIMEGLSPKAQ